MGYLVMKFIYFNYSETDYYNIETNEVKKIQYTKFR